MCVCMRLWQAARNASIGERGAAGPAAAEMLLRLRSAATKDGRVATSNGAPQRRSLNLARNLSTHLDQARLLWH